MGKEKQKIDTRMHDETVKLPEVSILGPKLNNKFENYCKKIDFTPGCNLKILACNNQWKLLPK